MCVNYKYLRVNVVDSNEQNMGRKRERILKGKSTFVKIQGDILWAGRHKLFVSFGASFAFLRLLAREGIRDCAARGSEPVQ